MVEKEKRPRAGHKEGSIYYVEARDRWVAEITLSTGKRKTEADTAAGAKLSLAKAQSGSLSQICARDARRVKPGAE